VFSYAYPCAEHRGSSQFIKGNRQGCLPEELHLPDSNFRGAHLVELALHVPHLKDLRVLHISVQFASSPAGCILAVAVGMSMFLRALPKLKTLQELRLTFTDVGCEVETALGSNPHFATSVFTRVMDVCSCSLCLLMHPQLSQK
jgi:hypothetical protein